MTLEETVARAICTQDPEDSGSGCLFGQCGCTGNRRRQARAAIQAMQSYQLPVVDLGKPASNEVVGLNMRSTEPKWEPK